MINLGGEISYTGNIGYKFTCYNLLKNGDLKKLKYIDIDFVPRRGDIIRMELYDSAVEKFYSYTGEVQRIVIDIVGGMATTNQVILREIEIDNEL